MDDAELMGSTPLVSVVVPCYNMIPGALREAVASARAQTYPHVEIIITDDGSDASATLEALNDLEGSGVQVVRQSNYGVSAAVNSAVAASHGMYFMPLNDDIIEPPYIAEAVAAMQADDQVGVVYCRADLFGSVVKEWPLPPFTMKRQLTDNCIFVTALFRTEDWRAVGGFDETMRRGREDHDYMMRILGLGRRVHRLEGVYFHYRRGDVNSINVRVGASRPDLINAHAQILRNNMGLYAANAELLWESYFDLVDERNNLANRYRTLERLRLSKLGSTLWSAARLVQRRVIRRP